MKEVFHKIFSESSLTENQNYPGKFFHIKGGFSLKLVSTNAACSNQGTTCSGNNTGECINGFGTDCSKGTNTPATSCLNELCGD